MLDYNYFISYHKMIAIYLNKQQALDADPKAMQQIYFTGNPKPGGQTPMSFIIEEAKKKRFRGNCERVLTFFNIILV